jgi:hypothetical protein
LKVTYFNIAFCLVKTNDFQNANKFFEGAVNLLFQHSSLSIDDLVGIGMWIDEEGSMEEPLKSAFFLIQQASVNNTKTKDIEPLNYLLNIYDQAYIIQENSFRARE